MYRKNTIRIRDEQALYKHCMEKITEFLQLWGDIETPEKCNMCVKDYSLAQFQWYIGRRIDELDPNVQKLLEANIAK
jgi:hypothetical protein